MSAGYLSIQDIQQRWAMGRSFAYEAVAEMQQQGYLKRMWCGRHQRIAVESVERWEALHAEPQLDMVRSTVASLRDKRAPRPHPTSGKRASAAELLAVLRSAL